MEQIRQEIEVLAEAPADDEVAVVPLEEVLEAEELGGEIEGHSKETEITSVVLGVVT